MKHQIFAVAAMLVGLGAAPQVLAQAEVAKQVAALVQGVPHATRTATDLALAPDLAAQMGFISSIAVDDRNGLTYLLHRGDKADPVIVVDGTGKLVRSWGRGLFKTPHSIRIDPEGNVWTVDSMSSMILKFTPAGVKLLEIAVGGQPDPSKTTGTADIAFGPNGRLFIADGYGNARILEYDASGKKVREWGSHGDGPGQFNVPHALLVEGNAIFVADRENGRVQKFDLAGKFLAQWTGLVKPMSLSLAPDGRLLVAIGYRDSSNKERPWLAWIAALDLKTGKVVSALEVEDDAHGMVVADGLLLTGGTAGSVAAIHAFKIQSLPRQ